MAKKYFSETKKSKKKEKTVRVKRRRCNSKKNKELKSLFPILEPSIEEIINSLDEPVKQSQIYKDSDFKVEFPSDIDDTKFLELFKKGINYAKRRLDPQNLKILKKVLSILKDINGKNSNDEFCLKTCVNNLQKVYRIDLIFSLLTNKNKIEELRQISLGQIEKEFMQSIDYIIYMDNHAFNDALIYNENNNNNKKEIFPYYLFKDIIISPVVLKTYVDILEELYEVKTTKNKIKNIINNFLKNHSIYFLLMGIRRFGMTLYDGTILINRTYYGAAYTPEYAFVILWTLLHEIMNVLSRLERNNNNFYLDTDEFTKSGKIFSEESGNYFQQKLLLSILKQNSLTLLEAEYLLEKENYQFNTVEEFKKAFLDFRKRNISQIKCSQTFPIVKESNNKTISLEIGCYCGGERKRVNSFKSY